MLGSMMTKFVTLDATSCTGFVGNIFTFIPVLSFWCRQPLALNGKEHIKLTMAATLNDEGGSARFHREVYLSAATYFIGCFSPKLDMAPGGRGINGAIVDSCRVRLALLLLGHVTIPYKPNLTPP